MTFPKLGILNVLAVLLFTNVQPSRALILYTFQPTQSQIVNHHTAIELPPEIQHKEKLIKLLKKEVKRMMEVI